MVTIRIAFVHSFYTSDIPSGENKVVEAEVAALRRAGHQVELFAARTDDASKEFLFPIRSAFRVATGRGANPREAVGAFKPEILHIHNLFPNFGTHWVEGVEVPIVHTLHNFRPLCAAATLLRNGSVCTLCPDGHRWAGFRYACYRNSRTATLPLTWHNRRGVKEDPLLMRADRLVVMSRRGREIYEAAGVPAAKFVIWPHFVADQYIPSQEYAKRRRGWLYVGRLSREKGILELVEAWPQGLKLLIVGEGELRSQIESAKRGKDIDLLGSLDRAVVIQLMERSEGLVFPSLWFETFGLVYLEAIGSGLPVFSLASNVVGDLVEEHGTGWVAENMNELIKLVREISISLELRQHCRQTFQKVGTEQAYIERAEALYKALTRR